MSALIHDAHQRVLVVRRSKSDHFLPDHYELPGGRVKLGESLEAALKRKLDQELGINSAIPMYYTSLAQVNRHGAYVRAVFEVAYNQKTSILLDKTHGEYTWVDARQLIVNKVAADTKKILQQYLGKSAETLNYEINTTISIFTDGGSRGNPGPSAAAYVIYNNKKEIIESGGSYLGITTNNIAEYTAVVLALKAAQRWASKSDVILCNLDSLLVVNQMNGLYKIKNRELWPINQQIRDLITAYQQVRFNHVPREKNAAADAKVNEILDAHSHAL